MIKRVLTPIFIFLLVAIVLFSLFSVTTVKAYSVTINFDTSTVGDTYINSYLNTHKLPGKSAYNWFSVHSDLPYSGTRDFRMSQGEVNGVNEINDLGTFNYTYSGLQFMTSWEAYISIIGSGGLSLLFNNSIGQTVIFLQLIYSSNTVLYQDVDGHGHTINTSITTGYVRFGFEFVDNDTVNYFYGNSLVTDTPNHILSNCDIRTVYFGDYAAHTNHSRIWYIDDNKIEIENTITGNIPASTNGIIYVKVYDISTGKQLYIKSDGYPCGICPTDDYVSADFIDATASSYKLWVGAYTINSFPDKTATFTNLTIPSGIPHLHNLKVENGVGKVNGIDVFWSDRFIIYPVHNGSVISFYLSRIEIPPDLGYPNTGYIDFGNGITCEIGFNKINYSRPDTGVAEEVLFRYKCPTVAQLHSLGLYTGTYYMYFKRDMNYWDFFPGWDDYIGRFKIEVDLLNDWVYGSWSPSPTTDGFDEFTPFISSEGGFLNPATYLFSGLTCSPKPLHFYTSNTEFTLHGNITNIIPNPCNVSQTLHIYYDTNNPAYLRILDANNNTVFIRKVLTTVGISEQVYYPSSGGYYYVELRGGIWAFSPLGGVILDTASFYVTGEGYNTSAEYLICSPDRAISGTDTINIIFNTFKANTLIKVISPTGERTSFSRTVQPGNHKVSFFLPIGSKVGIWTISMIGNETMNTTFNVIAEYGNYVDFRKGSFYTYEPLTVYQTHTVEVDIILYKDAKPLLGYYHLLANENMQGSIVLLSRTSENMPDWVGDYKVEMWEMKDGIRKRLLSVDTTRIIYGNLPGDNVDIVITNPIDNFISGLPTTIKIILGLFLTLIFTLLPLIVGMALSSRNVDMPNMIYVAFFFLGLGVSCGIGLLNWALFFVILLGLVIYFVVQHQQNKG